MKSFLPSSARIVCIVSLVAAWLGCQMATAQNVDYAFYNSCENAQYVDSSFTQKIDSNTYYYFTANTYDLPVTVYFFPDTYTEEEPEVQIDFTCTPGQYKDPNVANLVRNAESYSQHFPFMPDLEPYVSEDGKQGYRLSFDRDILDVMAAFSVDYSVPVFVQMVSPVSGEARIDNKKTTEDCEKLSILVDKIDSIHLLANDTTAIYRMPFSDWYNNTTTEGLSFTWTGTTPLVAYITADSCHVDTTSNQNYYDKWTFSSIDADGNAFQSLPNSIYSGYAKKGILYVHFFAKENGKVIIGDYKTHTTTIARCQRNNISISFPTAEAGVSVTTSNVTSSAQTYYLVAETLRDKNLRIAWKPTNNHSNSVYFGKFCGFDLKYADPDVLDTLQMSYSAEDDMMYAYMPQVRMNAVVDKCTEGYLFLQITRVETGKFWLSEYTPIVQTCDEKSNLILATDTVAIPANSKEQTYKINQTDFLDGKKHTFKWKSTKSTYFAISDTCSYAWSPVNEHIALWQQIRKNEVLELSSAQLTEYFKDHADADGNLYIRMQNPAEGQLITSTIIEVPSSLQSTTIGNRTTRLVLEDGNIYIEVTEGDTTMRYDITGRRLE